MSFKYYVILRGGVTERSHSITGGRGGGTGGVKKGLGNFLMFPYNMNRVPIDRYNMSLFKMEFRVALRPLF